MQLDGKVVIVTGAARGIVRNMPGHCANAGAKVGRDRHQRLRPDPRFGEDGRRQCDRGQRSMFSDISGGPTAMVAAALEAYGRVDGLINNAGALPAHFVVEKFDAISEADWDATMCGQRQGHLELLASPRCPAMRPDRRGSIVNITSLAATYGLAYAIHYTTSKAAVIGLTRGLARELGRDKKHSGGFYPNGGICPGGRGARRVFFLTPDPLLPAKHYHTPYESPLPHRPCGVGKPL